ncbi:hypothetical protein DVK85_09535 [Flavobacterium arcticum]|uniref:Outer membrane protein beta-barrel domain-containing protein n=1 Tax=Flavobacterium arcticum TaxID=1784713 RepID=A0A345HD03_9FLAO|nr:hypothetical protein [Flavobacterium arcticum]AXG74463.1 hypothetical protein DVK85_09535 [Flavobacterium arcticum]KAF2512417.1 hypothetical protein E0W72_04130 [Flavobacterium arcticum]
MAKSYFIIFLLTFCTVTWAQNEEQSKLEEQSKIPKEYFRLYYIFPNGIGDNVIAKANKPVGGIGLGINFTPINRIHIIGGVEFIQYNISDKSLAGNGKRTNLSQLYLMGMYKISLGRKFELDPGISLGYMSIKQIKNSRSFGKQDAFCVTPSLTVDFIAIDNLRFFVGVNYCLAFAKTNTHPEYKKFFGQLQMLNITTGIKL